MTDEPRDRDGDGAGDGGGAGNGNGDGDGDSSSSSSSSDRDRDLAGEAARYRRRLREREAELEQLRAERQTDSERAVSEAVKQATDALTAQHRRELVSLRVQIASASRLRDPEDAAAHLDLDELAELADDPRELSAAVDRQLESLLERKPYLARDAGNGDGDDDGGAGRRRLADTASQGRRDDSADDGKDRGGADADSWLRTAARKL